ncbi:MAG: FAD-binding oxidoreductase [Planctomycetes bacterium]|jgi:FAD/FMN-containing dehydrogenase|nr:FAD-binding oxidoreductase [Planctomycetota bacterium]
MTVDPVVSALLAALGERAVLTAPEDRARFETGWRYGKGIARCVVRPASTDEVATALRICGEHGVRVVPQGANTGLVAASTPDASGAMVVLSLERLNRTIALDRAGRTVLVDGGVLLSQLNEALAKDGYWFPVDLGADPQIGGMVATNTGGTRLLKYGDVRHNLLGVEVVLGDGRVLTQLNTLRKNNTGLDPKHLFTGTTGVFGVVTRAVLQVAPLPKQRAVALVGCVDGPTVLKLLSAVEHELGDVLSAFEVMSKNALRAVFAHQPNLRQPFAELPRYATLVELSSTLPAEALALEAVLEARLGAFLETAGDAVVDVLVGKGEEFWSMRHHISESLRSEGKMLAFDISVPRSELPAFTNEVEALLAAEWPLVQLCDYGHWGDGGTHLNLVWNEAAIGKPAAEVIAALQPRIYELACVRYQGSYSAEHGVGPHNQRYYDRYTDPLVKQLCAVLGGFCDPAGRLGTVRLS